MSEEDILSKEEIKEAKECLNEIIENTYAEGKAIKLNNLKKYIEQLEEDVYLTSRTFEGLWLGADIDEWSG